MKQQPSKAVLSLAMILRKTSNDYDFIHFKLVQ
jgi:hypothetical protein